MTHLRPDTDVVQAYRELRDRLIPLLRSRPTTDGDRPVPHCPAWSVQNVVAHLVGTPEDILAGRMEGVTTDGWTQAQVDRHAAESLAELADGWEAIVAPFDAVLVHIPAPVNSQLVMDAVTHEHDLRHALGIPGARDSLAVSVGLGWLLDRAEGTSPGLAERLMTSVASEFDLLRVLTGRRSLAQMSAFGLDTNELVALFDGTPLRPPAESIGE